MNKLRDRYNKLLSERNLILSRLNESKRELEKYRIKRLDIDVVQQILQTVATQVQNNFGMHIGSVVTKAIHHVFPECKDDMFVVRFRENRGQTECQLRIRSKNGSEKHPFRCRGGGMWDVISLALRCVVMSMEKPKKSRFILTDEPFKNLHGKEKREAALQMLHNICKNMRIQCVAVHQSDSDGDDKEILHVLSKDGTYVYKVSLVSYENSKVERVV